jgi:hypothetical protein
MSPPLSAVFHLIMPCTRSGLLTILRHERGGRRREQMLEYELALRMRSTVLADALRSIEGVADEYEAERSGVVQLSPPHARRSNSQPARRMRFRYRVPAKGCSTVPRRCGR